MESVDDDGRRDCVDADFVDANLIWLEEAMGRGGSPEKALLIYAALEGAMGVAALKRDSAWIVRVGESACEAVL